MAYRTPKIESKKQKNSGALLDLSFAAGKKNVLFNVV